MCALDSFYFQPDKLLMFLLLPVFGITPCYSRSSEVYQEGPLKVAEQLLLITVTECVIYYCGGC